MSCISNHLKVDVVFVLKSVFCGWARLCVHKVSAVSRQCLEKQHKDAAWLGAEGEETKGGRLHLQTQRAAHKRLTEGK